MATSPRLYNKPRTLLIFPSACLWFLGLSIGCVIDLRCRVKCKQDLCHAELVVAVSSCLLQCQSGSRGPGFCQPQLFCAHGGGFTGSYWSVGFLLNRWRRASVYPPAPSSETYPQLKFVTHLKIVANVFNQDVFYPHRSRGLFQSMRPKTIHDETKTKLLTSIICVVRTIYPSVPYTSIFVQKKHSGALGDSFLHFSILRANTWGV